MDRACLIAGLMLLTLASGTAAQSPSGEPATSASPAAASLYAPDDLASELPGEVRGLPLSVEKWNSDEFVEVYGPEQVTDLLAAVDRGTQDVRWAVTGSGDGSLAIEAIRIAGVDPEPLVEPLLLAFVLGEPSTDGVGSAVWHEIEGRDVFLATDLPEPTAITWLALYPKGEVLFVVYSHLADPKTTLAEVLANMP